MNEYEWIRSALHDRRISVVAEKTGLSAPTIRAIRDNEEANPTLSTLDALAHYLRNAGEKA